MLPSNAQLAVSLPRFDGPFALLLSLIRRHEYPMDRLPIVRITGQFLEYVREAQALDMDLGGEFIETASWLVLLKSRSMLPREAPAAAQQELREAVRKYELEREELEQTREKLRGLRSRRERVAAAGAARARRVEEVEEGPAPTAADVVRRVRGAMAAARARAAFRLGEDPGLTVSEQREWIMGQTGQFPAGTPFSTAPWFEAQPSPAARASLFLALLELGRGGEILVHQKRDFGPIYVKTQEPDRAAA